MTPAYVSCLQRVANGETVPEPELQAALRTVAASDARFGRDVHSYRANPTVFHAAIREPIPPAPIPPPPHLQSKEIRLAFAHGLGDNCQAIAMLKLWQARGFDVKIFVNEDKRWLWSAAGFDLLDSQAETTVSHSWLYPKEFGQVDRPDWEANKVAFNLCTDCLPALGARSDLWPELSASRPDIRAAIGDAARSEVAAFLEDLPRPLVLIHSQGSAWAERKSLEPVEVMQLYQSLLPRFPGSLLLLDWSGQGPIAHDPRVKRIPPWDLEHLAALYIEASLLIGIDSGPAHLARLTDTPTLMVTFPSLPARHVALPHEKTRFLVPRGHAEAWRSLVHEGWESLAYEGGRPGAEGIAGAAAEMVGVESEDVLFKSHPQPKANRTDAISEVASSPDRFKRHEDFWIRHGDLGGQDACVIGEVIHSDTYRLDQLTPKKGGLIVVDVGAHIGTFAKAWHEKDPSATVICVEACPENLPILACNVAGFASTIHAACSYISGRLALRNSIKAGGSATGGSIVLPLEELDRQLAEWGAAPHLYWEDRRLLPKVTLEQIIWMLGVDHIDLLKLDCEASEFSILAGTDVSKIGCIVGEWHGVVWDDFRKQRLAGWEYEVTHGTAGSNIGAFRARNPGWCNV